MSRRALQVLAGHPIPRQDTNSGASVTYDPPVPCSGRTCLLKSWLPALFAASTPLRLNLGKRKVDECENKITLALHALQHRQTTMCCALGGAEQEHCKAEAARSNVSSGSISWSLVASGTKSDGPCVHIGAGLPSVYAISFQSAIRKKNPGTPSQRSELPWLPPLWRGQSLLAPPRQSRSPALQYSCQKRKRKYPKPQKDVPETISNKSQAGPQNDALLSLCPECLEIPKPL